MTARQIVNNLLEYGFNPDAPEPGGADDPWRMTPGSPLAPMQFTGKRPGGMPWCDTCGSYHMKGAPCATQAKQTDIPTEQITNPDDLLDAPPEEKPSPVPIKHKPINPRFKWKPPGPAGP